jgi:signal peptidase II
VYYFLIAAIIIAIDQLSKWLVVVRLELNERVSVLGEFFEIMSHRNTGAAFGILSGQRWFFIIITIIIVCGLVWYIRKTANRREVLAPLAYSVILGGAIGNFIDRARQGEVIDFLKFRFQFDWFGQQVDYTYPIFNIADAAIFCGVVLAIIHVWRDRGDEREPEEVEEKGSEQV